MGPASWIAFGALLVFARHDDHDVDLLSRGLLDRSVRVRKLRHKDGELS